MFRHLTVALTLTLTLFLGATTMAKKAKANENPLENTLYLDLKDGRVVIEMRPDLAPKHVKRIKELVREGFAAKVWIVSPTTCMATLNTMRAILKDARMQEQAGAIRRELGMLFQDVERLGTRVENLDRHFGQASKDLADIKISADKAGKRARRLDNFDFEELAPDPEPAKLVMAPIAKKT